jgi:ubiquinone/menaquinone biosynthesis C-methylase UbiE
MASTGKDDRLRRYWDKHARGYDRDMRLWDRVAFGESRAWICRQAAGDVLEVAIGTGLNLPHYPAEVRLTGVEWSPAMLAQARHRAEESGRAVALREGDAQALPFPDGSFDTVVCTLSLCAIPNDQRAVAEMVRVLRPGGRLLLLDHVAGSSRPVRAIQRLLELVTVPLGGEHFLRRPLHQVKAAGLDIERHDRFKLGIVERLAARKPAAPPSEPAAGDGPSRA